MEPVEVLMLSRDITILLNNGWIRRCRFVSTPWGQVMDIIYSVLVLYLKQQYNEVQTIDYINDCVLPIQFNNRW